VQLPLWDARTKRCSGCGRFKPLEAFNRRSTAKDGLQWNCRQCNAAWHAANRAHHNALIRARNLRLRADNQQKLMEYLREHPCVDCGEPDVRVLEFDHLRDKVGDISVLVRNWVWERVLEEIAKCDVLCANCHRRRTLARANSYRTRFA
jgi:hypothetical protein